MAVHTQQEKYFFYFLLFVALVLAFFVFRPFLIVLILSASFAVVMHPLYEWFLRRVTTSSPFAAFYTVALFVLIVGVPLVGISFLVYGQAVSLFESGSLIQPLIDTVTGILGAVLPAGFETDVEKMVIDFVSGLSSNITHIFASTLSTMFSALLVLMSMFFFLKDGKMWRDLLVRMSPLVDSYDLTILKELKATINGVIKGYLLIALIQGLLVGVGLIIFGVPNAAFWGLVAGIAALIPFIGTGLVAIPAVVYLYVQGDTTSAIGFAIWSAVLVGLIDNILNPFIIGREVHIHPLVILFAVLGGISFLGPAGILVGPLIVSLLYTLGSIYLRKFEQKPKKI